MLRKKLGISKGSRKKLKNIFLKRSKPADSITEVIVLASLVSTIYSAKEVHAEKALTIVIKRTSCSLLKI